MIGRKQVVVEMNIYWLWNAPENNELVLCNYIWNIRNTKIITNEDQIFNQKSFKKISLNK